MSEIIKKAQLENSKIPKRYLIEKKMIPIKEDEANFDRLSNIANQSEKFIKEGHNLLIYSRFCGNGKTSWACKISLRYINDYASNYAIETPVLFINAAEYINKKKSAISDKRLIEEISQLDRDIYKADLVIWDDIATKALSEYDMEQLYVFINNRVSNMKSNIFTSNCSLSEMPRIMGDRLGSRVVNNSICVEFVGTDRRKDEF